MPGLPGFIIAQPPKALRFDFKNQEKEEYYAATRYHHQDPAN